MTMPMEGRSPDGDQRCGRGCKRPRNDVSFGSEDIDILNDVLNIVPELKICVQAVSNRRRKNIPFPIVDHDGLFDLFDGNTLNIANHVINKSVIERYIQPNLFPIHTDDELMRVVYLGLGACNHDLAWALQAPPYARDLLEELGLLRRSDHGARVREEP